MNKLKFDELPISQAMRNAVADMGFEEASPIQSEAIPHILQGKDILGQARTGTGKTAAFAIPAIEKLDTSIKGIQTLILVPTRELVIQVAEEIQKLLKYLPDIAVVPIYGGQEIERQLRALKKNPQIIIGTPGRTLDHINRKSVRMDTVRMVILDEADEMLNMGFRDDIELILKDTPSDRQTILFSATMSPDILKLTKNYQKNPMRIDVTAHKLKSPPIEQVYFEIAERAKPEGLARLIEYHNIKQAIIFCNTRNQVDNLVEILKARGYFTEGLHGDMTQKQREKVMNGFRKGTVELLVATDVAGRGIDINDLSAVFNYDLPRDDEDYVHRIGRTGRAGKTGKAFTFITGREIYSLKRIEKAQEFVIQRQDIPTLGGLDESRFKTYNELVQSVIEAGDLHRYIDMVERIMKDRFTAMDVAAAIMKITLDKKNEGYDEKLNFEAPPVSKDRDGGGRGGRSGGGYGGSRSSGGGSGSRSGGGSRGPRTGGSRDGQSGGGRSYSDSRSSGSSSKKKPSSYESARTGQSRSK
jgi:ATP-dependent RNA helicase DeaD